MNRINIENKTEALVDEKHISQVVMEALTKFKKENLFVEIIFVNEEESKDLNKTHRNIDAPTDVLSFPQSPAPGAPIEILGSIVISPQIVDDKKETLDDVVKHGLLHLLGFDHEENEEKWEKSANKINCTL